MPKHALRKVLITGASRGVGRSVAQRLAQQRGFELHLLARDQKALVELADQLEAFGARPTLHVCDLTDPKAISVLDPLLATVDILVNNAGVGSFGSFLDVSLEKQRELLNLNCWAPLHLTFSCAQHMKIKNSGVIVNVASLAAFFSIPYFAVYSASKSFLLSIGEALDYELRPFGVRVCTLCPGGIATSFHRTAQLPDDIMKKFAGSLATPEQVAVEVTKLFDKPKTLRIPGVSNRLVYYLSWLMPRQLRRYLAARIYQGFLNT